MAGRLLQEILPGFFVLRRDGVHEGVLTYARDKRSGRVVFRSGIRVLSYHLAHALTQHRYRPKPCMVETPLEQTSGMQFSKPKALIRIERAGRGMAGAFRDYFPGTPIRRMGLKRDERAGIASLIWSDDLSLLLGDPKRGHVEDIVFLDIMFAGGSTIVTGFDYVVSLGEDSRHLVFACILATPEGVAALRRRYPQVSIYAAVLDRCIDEKKMIRPGFGDAGDRWCG